MKDFKFWWLKLNETHHFSSCTACCVFYFQTPEQKTFTISRDLLTCLNCPVIFSTCFICSLIIAETFSCWKAFHLLSLVFKAHQEYRVKQLSLMYESILSTCVITITDWCQPWKDCLLLAHRVHFVPFTSALFADLVLSSNLSVRCSQLLKPPELQNRALLIQSIL